MSARVAVVAVTYYPGETLDTFLDSLVGATRTAVPVVLADNADGPADPAVARAAQRPGVTVLGTGGNLGYGRAANAGVAATDADLVVVANPDVTWGPGSLDVLVDAAGRWAAGGTFGPLIHTSDGAVYPSARRLPTLRDGVGHALLGWFWPRNPWTRAYRLDDLPPVERTTGWLSGSCLLVRRTAFESVGGFDPAYFMYFEDLDLGARIARAGWHNVYVPAAEVVHDRAHATSRYAASMATAHHRSARTYVARSHPGLRWLPLRCAVAVGLALRAALARAVPRVAAGAPPLARLDDRTRPQRLAHALRTSRRIPGWVSRQRSGARGSAAGRQPDVGADVGAGTTSPGAGTSSDTFLP